MHTNWFSRLGSIGWLNLIHFQSGLEYLICGLLSFQVDDFPYQLFIYQRIWFIVLLIIFQLCRHFIFVDGSWATGKCPPLRKGYRKWFVVFFLFQALYSIGATLICILFFPLVWLLLQALLIMSKIVLLVHAKRVFSAAATTQGC